MHNLKWVNSSKMAGFNISLNLNERQSSSDKKHNKSLRHIVFISFRCCFTGSLPFYRHSTVKQTKLFHSISEMSLVRSSDWLELIYDIAFGVYIISCGRFPFRKKNPEISVGAKVEFPIGKKLFHLVVNPGTSRCPTVDLELVQTTRNVNGTRHSVRKFQPGKRTHLFRFSTFSGNVPVGRTDETCSIYRWTGNSGNFD